EVGCEVDYAGAKVKAVSPLAALPSASIRFNALESRLFRVQTRHEVYLVALARPPGRATITPHQRACCYPGKSRALTRQRARSDRGAMDFAPGCGDLRRDR